jgi:hypothetical protein
MSAHFSPFWPREDIARSATLDYHVIRFGSFDMSHITAMNEIGFLLILSPDQKYLNILPYTSNNRTQLLSLAYQSQRVLLGRVSRSRVFPGT